MLFNSLTFFLFLLIVYSLCRVLPHRGQNLMLLAASYVFYGWWDIRFLFLIALSTSLDFTCGLAIHSGVIDRKQRATASVWVILSAFFFVVVQWSKLNIHDVGSTWNEMFSWGTGWWILVIICCLTLVLNLIGSRLLSLSENVRKRVFLLLSIVGNVSILGFFKYFNFFIDSFELVFRGMGLDPSSLHLDIALPVGISFYTFQTMTYTIDVYRGKIAATASFSEYALCVAFFPKLLAGPIERAATLLPQITSARHLTAGQTVRGLNLLFYGLFKKVVIADGVSRTASWVFSGANQVGWSDLIVGSLCFAIQIYCDFSGYSDMAIGTADLFGFSLMRNFHFPYFARNPSEFWGRWHISLSSWFRDYVFFPLGGPYGSTLRWVRNVMVTFFVTGLWHGAAWNYVVWGLYHGALLCLHRIRLSLRPPRKRSRRAVVRVASTVFFFLLTCYGWILFRAHSFDQIRSLTRTLFLGVGGLHLNAVFPTPAATVGLPIFLLAEYVGYRTDGKRLDEVLPVPVWTAAVAGMIFAFILGATYGPSSFIYFVF